MSLEGSERYASSDLRKQAERAEPRDRSGMRASRLSRDARMRADSPTARRRDFAPWTEWVSRRGGGL